MFVTDTEFKQNSIRKLLKEQANIYVNCKTGLSKCRQLKWASNVTKQYINKIEQDATVCRYLLQNYSTFFGCPSHPLSGVHKTVTAASGTGHNI